jgi:hypothetical protein
MHIIYAALYVLVAQGFFFLASRRGREAGALKVRDEEF